MSKLPTAALAAVLGLSSAANAWGRSTPAPAHADLPRAHQSWQLNDVSLGAWTPVTAASGDAALLFVVERRSGSVIAIDVASGKQRWSVPFPPQAGVNGPPKESSIVGPRVLADDVLLSVEGPVVVVRWGPKLESRLALGDGHELARRPLDKSNPESRRRREKNPRWRVVGERVEEIGGGGHSFELPSYLVGNRDVEIVDSGERVVLVESAGRVDGATMVTWTVRNPKPVILRRPTVTTAFQLIGDQLLAAAAFDHFVLMMTLSKLDPALSKLVPAEAVTAARAEAGPEARLLWQDLLELPQMGTYWLERLEDKKDSLHSVAIDAMSLSPDARALPFLLDASNTTDGDPSLSVAEALAAQDDPRAAKRLLEVAKRAGNGWQARMWREAGWEQLWRTGRATEAGLCKAHGEQALAALATTAADGTIGTANPFLFQDVAPDGSWTVLCQAREDTNQDGKISVNLGLHGEAMGDQMRPFLIVGSGPGAAFDEILASDATGRFVAARTGACLSLIDTRKKTEVVFANADLRDDDGVFGSARGAAFDRRGEHLLYLRGGARGDRLVVRTLATGGEIEIDPGAGRLWRAHIDPRGRWVAADMIAERQWPRVVTTLSGRTCRGPAMSYSTYGMTSHPAVVRRWAGLTGGPTRTVEGLIVPFGDGVLVRRDDDALVRVDSEGATTEVAPAACHGTLVGISAPGRSLAAVCSAPGEREGTLTIFGGGDAVVLGATRVPATDRWQVVLNDVVEWQGKFVDLDSRRLVPRPKECCGIAITDWKQTEQGIFAERGDGAKLRSLHAPDPDSHSDVSDGPLWWASPTPKIPRKCW